jgi:molybdopterin-containing oxidoreductase family iron-sulfur binding subunit
VAPGAGSRKPEAGSWKPEAGSWKPEAGSWNLEAEMDFAAIRSRLAGSEGRLYWRSLGELADTPEFREYLHREFPDQASEWNDPTGRRNFLKLMSASLALAGVGACTKQPPETLVPYVRQPEEIVPGRPLYFASAIPMSGTAMPVLVESHMGRPTKIEGNPEHPASRGGTDALTQAAVLDLYDPDRAQTVTHRGQVQGWSAFVAALQQALAAQKARGGAGLHLLTPPVTSPSLAEMLAGILRDYPRARWHQYDPVARPAARGPASAQANAVYRFDVADVVVALDADFLTTGPGSVRYSKDFGARRRIADDTKVMNRLYAIESTPSLTGAKADHRLALRASDIEGFARQLAGAVGGAGSGAQPPLPGAGGADAAKWVSVIAKDLQAHKGRSVVVAGDYQTDGVRAAARAINDALGNSGTTVLYGASIEAAPQAGATSIAELAQAMDAGQVEILVIMGGNPVFTAPADLRFEEKLTKVGLAVYHGTHADETSHRCHWHIPETHALESWGDTRAFDGTVTLTQPLIAPLYEGGSGHEFLAAFTAQPSRRGLEIVKDFWTRTYSSGQGGWTFRHPREGEAFPNPDAFWRTALHEGFIAGTSLADGGPATALTPPALPAAPASGAPATAPAPPGTAAASQPADSQPPAAAPSAASSPQAPVLSPVEGLEIIFRPDPTVWDGRFANNGWLQELPKPFSKVTWDATAWIAPGLAEERGLRDGDVIDLQYRGNTAQMPVFVVPGHPAQSVTVFFGYGRRMAGRVGNAVGLAQQFNAFRLRTSDAPWFGTGLVITRTGTHHPLATTQEHHAMEGRAPVRTATLDQYRAHPAVIHDQGHTPARTLTLYPDHEYEGYKWGMAIDLASCTGCSTCTIACQAENNIPVIGKAQVLRSREMHWIRVDHYFAGSPDHPESFHQPVPCMQCENAPCETVCPVAATTHSAEGLNDMVYNRCVGTRYCSNNCPYKVRRFNFLLYADWDTQSLYGARNPDVTVRSRGVMEKCTYCVQRINQARVDAKRENRRIRDGEIVPACASACPADAIVFGDVNDPNSQVNRLKAQQRNYGVLEDLNTRPRTTYLADIRNPNPELAPAPAAGQTTGH